MIGYSCNNASWSCLLWNHRRLEKPLLQMQHHSLFRSLCESHTWETGSVLLEVEVPIKNRRQNTLSKRSLCYGRHPAESDGNVDRWEKDKLVKIRTTALALSQKPFCCQLKNSSSRLVFSFSFLHLSIQTAWILQVPQSSTEILFSNSGGKESPRHHLLFLLSIVIQVLLYAAQHLNDMDCGFSGCSSLFWATSLRQKNVIEMIPHYCHHQDCQLQQQGQYLLESDWSWLSGADRG